MIKDVVDWVKIEREVLDEGSPSWNATDYSLTDKRSGIAKVFKRGIKVVGLRIAIKER